MAFLSVRFLATALVMTSARRIPPGFPDVVVRLDVALVRTTSPVLTCGQTDRRNVNAIGLFFIFECERGKNFRNYISEIY
jgi:hypothetical protein